MSKLQKRVRAENNDPINFTCGQCKKVNEFDKENPLVCTSCEYGKVVTAEELGAN